MCRKAGRREMRPGGSCKRFISDEPLEWSVKARFFRLLYQFGTEDGKGREELTTAEILDAIR